MENKMEVRLRQGKWKREWKGNGMRGNNGRKVTEARRNNRNNWNE